jgi:hypothetical protein
MTERSSSERRTRRVLLGLAAGLVALGVWVACYWWGQARQLGLNTALYDAIRLRDRAAARASLRRGADPNAPWAGGMRGGTPLAWAVGERDPKMIRLLLEHRADPRRRDADGRTALDYARSSGDPALIDLLSAPLGSSSR